MRRGNLSVPFFQAGLSKDLGRMEHAPRIHRDISKARRWRLVVETDEQVTSIRISLCQHDTNALRSSELESAQVLISTERLPLRARRVGEISC